MYAVFAFFFASIRDPDAETKQMIRCYLMLCDILDALRSMNRFPTLAVAVFEAVDIDRLLHHGAKTQVH